MAGKSRKDARQVTQDESPLAGADAGKSRQVTEISAERAASMVQRVWTALGEQWLIPYVPNTTSVLVDETIATRTPLASARHAFFELIGDRLCDAARMGSRETVINWEEANRYAELRSGKSLSESNFVKSISLWRKGQTGSQNAKAIEPVNGWLPITSSQRERAEVQIVAPRNMSHAMTTKVIVNLLQESGATYRIRQPEGRLPTPTGVAVEAADATARARAVEDASSADRLHAEARTLERRGHREIASSLRKLARSLYRAAREHRIIAVLLAVFFVSSALYAIPTVRRGVRTVIREVRHYFVKRVLLQLRDFTRLAQVRGTIVVRQADDVVHLTSRPLTARLRGKAVTTVWMRFGVVPPMLIHRPSEDVYSGTSWDIPVDEIDDQGIVVLALLADARDVQDPARSVRDEDVQADYIGLRRVDDRIEVFDVDTLVPPPRPPKDQHALRGLVFDVPARN
ncbi:MAG TPA: hypothetical protein VGJ81_12450 [Thermoanaerobaculia bacterium]|jgi:hypothetical protein